MTASAWAAKNKRGNIARLLRDAEEGLAIPSAQSRTDIPVRRSVCLAKSKRDRLESLVHRQTPNSKTPNAQ